jgi:hypothetical protein
VLIDVIGGFEVEVPKLFPLVSGGMQERQVKIPNGLVTMIIVARVL